MVTTHDSRVGGPLSPIAMVTRGKRTMPMVRASGGPYHMTGGLQGEKLLKGKSYSRGKVTQGSREARIAKGPNPGIRRE